MGYNLNTYDDILSTKSINEILKQKMKHLDEYKDEPRKKLTNMLKKLLDKKQVV